MFCFHIKIDSHHSKKDGCKNENIKDAQLLIKHHVSFINWRSKTGNKKKNNQKMTAKKILWQHLNVSTNDNRSMYSINQ